MVQALATLPGVHDVNQALALYTERHFKRMNRLLQSTFVLDYMLQGMQVYAADGSGAAEQSQGGGSGVYMRGITAAAAQAHGPAVLSLEEAAACDTPAVRKGADAESTGIGSGLDVEGVPLVRVGRLGGDVVDSPDDSAEGSGKSVSGDEDTDNRSPLMGWGAFSVANMSDAVPVAVAEEAGEKGTASPKKQRRGSSKGGATSTGIGVLAPPVQPVAQLGGEDQVPPGNAAEGAAAAADSKGAAESARVKRAGRHGAPGNAARKRRASASAAERSPPATSGVGKGAKKRRRSDG